MSAAPKNMDYQKYFLEDVPLKLEEGEALKHEYTVEITRALFSEESFKLYQAYQEKIHDEKDKDKEGYERFLCKVPLFDPKAAKIPDGLSEEE